MDEQLQSLPDRLEEADRPGQAGAAVIGIVETVAIFVLVFAILALG